jgi:hypothetical protein
LHLQVRQVFVQKETSSIARLRWLVTKVLRISKQE